VTALLTSGVGKEVRALAPTCAAVLGAVVVGSQSSGYFLPGAGLLAFGVGSITLGAQAFGHEYTSRTLWLLLSQPVTRQRLFLNKLVVLAAMLATLTAATLLLYGEPLRRAASSQMSPAMFVLIAACALCLAPWLSMVCRSALAATVFTIVIPGLITVAATIVAGLRYGFDNAAAIDRFTDVMFWSAAPVVCAAGLVSAWWTFRRLEVIEGRGADVQIAEALRLRSAATVARRYHPFWALLWKELRLQQMAFVVAALYVGAAVTLAWIDRSRPDAGDTGRALLLLYAALQALLIGSLASAEERQFGTAESQLLLPTPVWQQWTVKIAVAWGLFLALGVGLPELLGVSLMTDDRGWAAIAFIVLTTSSVYFSSWCRSAISALILAGVGAVAMFLTAAATRDFVGRLPTFRYLDRSVYSPQVVEWTLAAMTAGLIALLLSLALRNHRSFDRNIQGTLAQAAGIGAYLVGAAIVLATIGVR